MVHRLLADGELRPRIERERHLLYMLLLGVKLCKGGEHPCNSLFVSVSVSVSMCMSISISISTSIQRQEHGEMGSTPRFIFRRVHFTVLHTA